MVIQEYVKALGVIVHETKQNLHRRELRQDFTYPDFFCLIFAQYIALTASRGMLAKTQATALYE